MDREEREVSFETFFPADLTSVIPAQKLGLAEIQHFEVSEQAAKLGNLRAAMHGSYEDMVQPGKYTRLLVAGRLMMTDTPMEKRTNLGFMSKAKGRVLVAGLGIGMILHKLLEKPEVTEVVVVEKYPDVIKLVAESLPEVPGKELIHVCADIFDWKPVKGEKFDTIYADIWPDICTDNLKDITKLKRRFRSSLAPGGWMGAWVEDRLRVQARREKRRGW